MSAKASAMLFTVDDARNCVRVVAGLCEMVAVGAAADPENTTYAVNQELMNAAACVLTRAAEWIERTGDRDGSGGAR